MNEIVLQWIEDFEFRDELLERLHVAFSRSDREGIHISDLIYCLRKAWYRRQPGYEQDLTDDSILYFVRGRSLGDLIEKMFPKREFIVEHDGVIGTIDAVDEGAVYEIKTTKKLWKDEPSRANALQCRYYMAMRNERIGYLLYYEYFTNRLRVFKFFAKTEELANTLKEISFKKYLLELALTRNDVELLPFADDDFDCYVCDFEQCVKHKNYKGDGEK